MTKAALLARCWPPGRPLATVTMTTQPCQCLDELAATDLGGGEENCER